MLRKCKDGSRRTKGSPHKVWGGDAWPLRRKGGALKKCAGAWLATIVVLDHFTRFSVRCMSVLIVNQDVFQRIRNPLRIQSSESSAESLLEDSAHMFVPLKPL